MRFEVIKSALMMPVRPLVLCGPSGVGKSSLMRKLMEEFKEAFGFSVSHTTRLPRNGEKDGQHYHFVPMEEMEKSIQEGAFIETAVYSGNLYGTSKKAVHDVLKKNRICILDIDMQGVIQIKNSDLNAHYVFIKPPSLEILEKRLRDRGTETEETLSRRLSLVKREMAYGAGPGNFDMVITNDDLEEAYQKLRNYILPEIKNLSNF